MEVEVVTRWFGVFAVEAGRLTEARYFPAEKPALLERWKLRREGRLAPEEEKLVHDLHAAGKGPLVSRDRRLASLGVGSTFGHVPVIQPGLAFFDDKRGLGPGHALALEQARIDLALAWDPSVHLEEAVRSLEDLDEVLNVLGERLSSWWGREAPEVAADEESSRSLAETLLLRNIREGSYSDEAPGPSLAEARAKLAEAWIRAEEARGELERAVEAEAPERFPNLVALLGPTLTARMLSQAGGLARMARLPASTIQVLGAERAFFEHLRGRGPPPRHGLLFLHPAIHGAPRGQRGKIARALSGKIAIAARRDLQGAESLPALSDSFERRLKNIREQTKARGPRADRPPRRTGTPPGAHGARDREAPARPRRNERR